MAIMQRTDLEDIVLGIFRAHLCNVAKNDAACTGDWKLGIGIEGHRQASINITGRIFEKWINQ